MFLAQSLVCLSKVKVTSLGEEKEPPGFRSGQVAAGQPPSCNTAVKRSTSCVASLDGGKHLALMSKMLLAWGCLLAWLLACLLGCL